MQLEKKDLKYLRIKMFAGERSISDLGYLLRAGGKKVGKRAEGSEVWST